MYNTVYEEMEDTIIANSFNYYYIKTECTGDCRNCNITCKEDSREEEE